MPPSSTTERAHRSVTLPGCDRGAIQPEATCGALDTRHPRRRRRPTPRHRPRRARARSRHAPGGWATPVSSAPPTPHRLGGDRRRERRAFDATVGIDAGGLHVEVGRRPLALTAAVRADHRHHVAAGDVVEQRQQLVADAVATEGRVVVLRVDDDVDAERSGRARGSRARRSPSNGRRSRVGTPASPARPGAAQQRQQDRLGLVVRGVARRGTSGAECRMARALRARASRLRPGLDERHVRPRTPRRTARPAPRPRRPRSAEPGRRP